jgi:hypothetical protein
MAQGATEEVLRRCSKVFVDGNVVELTRSKREEILSRVENEYNSGMVGLPPRSSHLIRRPSAALPSPTATVPSALMTLA